MKEGLENSGRRKFIKGLSTVGASTVLAGLPTYGKQAEAKELKHVPKEPDSWSGIKPGPEHKRIGEYVKISDLLEPKLPPPDPLKVLGTDTGLIISKRFHRFWLFKNGELLKIGPIGSARTDRGQSTPEGLFSIYRKEGEDYSSGEFPARDPNEPNMPFSSFFHRRGIAIHGSLNYIVRKRHGVDVEFLRLDNSHGCTNARKADAKIVYDELKTGDRVAVLP